MNLIRFDGRNGEYGSKLLNFITFGPPGGNFCGRLYLYRKYTSKRNPIVNFFFYVIDSTEEKHCRKAYLLWKMKVRQRKVFVKDSYKYAFAFQKNSILICWYEEEQDHGQTT